MIALDASALLAFLFREEGAERVAAHFSESCLSAVNLAEVIGRFVRDGHDAQLIPRTSRLGLSLGDRACLALALSRSIPALTADRDWKKLKLGLSIVVIR